MTETRCPVNDYTAIRRRDRAVEDDSWIAGFLSTCAIGTLATVSDGQPFLNTNIFVYDQDSHSILFHTAGTGRTRSNVEASEKVCFTVAEMGRLLPAKRALNFSVEYSGVVVFGTGSILEGENEARAALGKIMAKSPGRAAWWANSHQHAWPILQGRGDSPPPPGHRYTPTHVHGEEG